MSKLHQAVSRLYKTLDKLEHAAAAAEQKAARRSSNGSKPQTADLFGAPQPAASTNVYKFDPSSLASRLDATIEKVEQILKEG